MRENHAQAVRDAAAEVLNLKGDTAEAVRLIGRLYTIAEAIERGEPLARLERRTRGQTMAPELAPIEYLRVVR